MLKRAVLITLVPLLIILFLGIIIPTFLSAESTILVSVGFVLIWFAFIGTLLAVINYVGRYFDGKKKQQ